MKKRFFRRKVNLIAFSHFPSEFSGEGLTVKRSVCLCVCVCVTGGVEGGGGVGVQKVSVLSNPCETNAPKENITLWASQSHLILTTH